MVYYVAVVVGFGIATAGIGAVWLLVRVGILREPSWSFTLGRRNPSLRLAMFFGVGVLCGTVVAAGALLIVDFVYHQPDLWAGQLRGILLGAGSVALGGLLWHGWLQLARLPRKQKTPRK